jgi:hypothetical protein
LADSADAAMLIVALLHFMYLCICDLDVYTIAWHRSLPLLSITRWALHAPHLKELVFSVGTYHKEVLAELQWDQIGELLASSQVCSFRRVKFSINRWGERASDDALEEAITAWLPRWCARNTVIFLYLDG